MSMIFNFFATFEEVYELWDCIGDLPGMQLLESDSRPDRSNREFDRFPRSEWGAEDRDFSVAAWASDVGGAPRTKQIIFEPATVERLGAVGRTTLVSPAFVRLGSVRPPSDGLIGPCELIYWTEKLAAKSRHFDADQLEEIDWKRLAQRVTAVKRLITSRSAGKWRSAPVSPRIAEALSTNDDRLWLWGATGTI